MAEVLEGADVASRGMALRMDGGAPFVTDEAHHILDLSLGRIGDPLVLEAALLRVPGVVETGLFLGLASVAVIGEPSGNARVIGG